MCREPETSYDYVVCGGACVFCGHTRLYSGKERQGRRAYKRMRNGISGAFLRTCDCGIRRTRVVAETIYPFTQYGFYREKATRLLFQKSFTAQKKQDNKEKSRIRQYRLQVRANHRRGNRRGNKTESESDDDRRHKTENP